MNEYWFKPKRYGLGAAPSTWKGWALTLGFVAIIVVIALIPPAHPLVSAGVTFVLTTIFVFIAWRKTEGGWRWRWGDDDRR